MDEAEQLCDRLVVMDGGRIVAEGSPRALIRECRPARWWSCASRPTTTSAAWPPQRGRARRAGRGAARPRAGLHRRRRRGRGRPCTAPRSASAVRARAALARSRTSSCGSPAARWSTDDGDRWTRTATPSRPRPPPPDATPRRRRGACDAALAVAATAAPGGARRSRASSSPLLYLAAMGFGLGALVNAAPAPRRCRRRAATCSSSRRAARRHSHADGASASRPIRCSARSSGSGSTTPCSRRRSRPWTSSPGTCCFVALRWLIACGVVPGRRGAASARALAAGDRSPLPVAVLCRRWRHAPAIDGLLGDAGERRRLRAAVPASACCRCSCSPARSSRSTSCPAGCSRSRGSRRCGTASTSARAARARAPRTWVAIAGALSPTCCSWVAAGDLARRPRLHRGGWSRDAPRRGPPCRATPCRVLRGAPAWPRDAGRAQRPRLPPCLAGPASRASSSRSSTCFSLGVGLGALVGDVDRPTATSSTTPPFVAPALLAASAMNGAMLDTTFNVFFKLKYAQALRRGARHAARRPATSRVGEIAWALLRGSLYAAMFLLVVMLAMGLIDSWWALLALPAAVLIGFAFAGGGHGGDDVHAQLAGLRPRPARVLPMFLFSATFYPLSTYPESSAGRAADAALPGCRPDPGARPGDTGMDDAGARRLPRGAGRRRHTPGGSSAGAHAAHLTRRVAAMSNICSDYCRPQRRETSRRPQGRPRSSRLSVRDSSVIGDDQDPSSPPFGDELPDHNVRTAHRERPFQEVTRCLHPQTATRRSTPRSRRSTSSSARAR